MVELFVIGDIGNAAERNLYTVINHRENPRTACSEKG